MRLRDEYIDDGSFIHFCVPSEWLAGGYTAKADNPGETRAYRVDICSACRIRRLTPITGVEAAIVNGRTIIRELA